MNELKEITGQGIQARVDGHFVKVGRASFVGAKESQSTKTAIYVAIDDHFSGTILFSDVLRPEAQATIRTIENNGCSGFDDDHRGWTGYR